MHRSLRIVAFLAVLAASAVAEDPSAWSIEEVLRKATRYGDTELRRAEKEQARERLFAMGADGLREVMERIHLENAGLFLLAQEMVDAKVSAQDGIPLLLGYLTHDRVEARRAAAYLLGFYPAPRAGSTKLLPLLDGDETRNAAIRTLGKWKAGRARDAIAGYLAGSTNERTRVAAANALRDIGNAGDIPRLVVALGDPVFTVRNTASRAIASYGWAARTALLRELETDVSPTARRQVIRLLGELRIRTASRDLKAMLADPDPGIRMDAAWALRMLDPSYASRAGADEITPVLDVDPTPAE